MLYTFSQFVLFGMLCGAECSFFELNFGILEALAGTSAYKKSSKSWDLLLVVPKPDHYAKAGGTRASLNCGNNSILHLLEFNCYSGNRCP